MKGKSGGGGVGVHQTKKAKKDYVYFPSEIIVYVRPGKQRCETDRDNLALAKSVNKQSSQIY